MKTVKELTEYFSLGQCTQFEDSFPTFKCVPGIEELVEYFMQRTGRYLPYVDDFPYFNDFLWILDEYTVAHIPGHPSYDCDAQHALFPDLFPLREQLIEAWNGCGFTVHGLNIYTYDEIRDYFQSLGMSFRSNTCLLEVLSPTSEDFSPIWNNLLKCFNRESLEVFMREYYERYYPQIEVYYRNKRN